MVGNKNVNKQTTKLKGQKVNCLNMPNKNKD